MHLINKQNKGEVLVNDRLGRELLESGLWELVPVEGVDDAAPKRGAGRRTKEPVK